MIGTIFSVLITLLVIYYIFMLLFSIISYADGDLKKCFKSKGAFIKSWIPFYGLKVLIGNFIEDVIKEFEE